MNLLRKDKGERKRWGKNNAKVWEMIQIFVTSPKFITVLLSSPSAPLFLWWYWVFWGKINRIRFENHKTKNYQSILNSKKLQIILDTYPSQISLGFTHTWIPSRALHNSFSFIARVLKELAWLLSAGIYRVPAALPSVSIPLFLYAIFVLFHYYFGMLFFIIISIK